MTYKSIINKPKKLSKDAQKIVDIIESKKAGDLIQITATKNRDDVLGGAFHGGGEQTIDFADLRVEESAGRGGFTVDSSVMHETIEAIEDRNSPCTIRPDAVVFSSFHSIAIEAENRVRRSQHLDPRTEGSDSAKKDSNGNLVITIDFTTHREIPTLDGMSGKITKAQVEKKQ